ncbi:G-protein beta WD-40 repeats containing protein [Reticulomyxa filosa]|uniref:G-protein beta WD-40 repeats containing protein n=1 Tax=Reticulomyxa filosa TaxID=46433 RepID=X6LUH3_RETFI|nr:G-protein beta WD-40 repeats containing protein [Reticulomyxa filosa]|eukprot:ETO05578.1 G-protein beta WD-40 repeats containing protein [Reticulomyxa filosa]
MTLNSKKKGSDIHKSKVYLLRNLIHDFDKIIVEYVMLYFLIEKKSVYCNRQPTLETQTKYFRFLRLLKGHTYTAESVNFWQMIVRLFHLHDETVRIWDTASGQQFQILKEHSALVCAAVFSPDGNTVVSGSADISTRVWDAISGRQIKKWKGHYNSVADVDFSPDGKTIVSCSSDKTIRLLDVESEQEIQKVIGHSNTVNSVKFSSNGQMILSPSDDKTICLWDVQSCKRLKELLGHSQHVLHAAFSTDEDETIRIWNVKTGHEI